MGYDPRKARYSLWAAALPAPVFVKRIFFYGWIGLAMLTHGWLYAADPAVQTAPWVPDQGDGTYHNPVLWADYSDPDVIRVGDDYYLVASSFTEVPGLPLPPGTVPAAMPTTRGFA